MKKKFRCPVTMRVFTAMYCRMPNGEMVWLIDSQNQNYIKSKPEEWIEITNESILKS